MTGIKRIDRRILKMGMADTAQNSLIALPIIMLFEVAMIARWFLLGGQFDNPGRVAYLAGYTALLVASLVTLLVIRHLKKDIESNYRYIFNMQAVYAVLIVLWTLEITFTGSHYFSKFEYLVYVTIVIIVPVFCFLPPLHWTPIQIVSAGAMLFMAHGQANFDAFLINFSVFTIISVVASWTLYRVRYTAYQRQLDLKEERDQTIYHAYHDALTGLPNRRSYIEDLEKLTAGGSRDTLILAMFDVNGLKQVNDSLGHDAGDELLKGAAECLTAGFSSLGSIYRVGGDEFTGILHGTEDDLARAMERYRKEEANWSGRETEHLSISTGTASCADHPDASIKEVETMADDAMYAMKKQYHKTHSASN